MTRINCIPVTELSGKHLVAEYRELPRVYALARDACERGEQWFDHPEDYRLGEGHVRFFYSRMRYVTLRHKQLIKEMRRRKYVPTFTDVPRLTEWPRGFRRDWTPNEAALKLNRARIQERTRETA